MSNNYSIKDAFKALDDIVDEVVNVSTIKTEVKKPLKEAIIPTTECQGDKVVFQDPYEEKEFKSEDEDDEIVDNEEKEEIAADDDKDEVDEDIDPLEDKIIENKVNEALSQEQCENVLGKQNTDIIKKYCDKYEKDYIITLNDIVRMATLDDESIDDSVEKLLGSMVECLENEDKKSKSLKEDMSAEEEKDFQHTDAINSISDTLSALIRDEWEAKDGYNNAVTDVKGMALASRGILDNDVVDKLISTLADIGEEESVHVGELQELLSLIKPVEKTKIEDGHKEVEDKDVTPENAKPEEGIKAEEESPVDESLKNKPLKEGETFDIQDKDEAYKAKEFKDKDEKKQPIEQVVDPDATITDDLKGSYVGNAILECPNCKTLIYKKPEDLKKQDIPEGTTIPDNQIMYNIDEECPHCGSKDGFTLVGQVAALTSSDADNLNNKPVESGELPTSIESGEEGNDLDGMTKVSVESGEVTNESLQDAEVDLSIPLKEEGKDNANKFEVLWFEGPDETTAKQEDAKTEEFDSEAEAIDFYKSLKDDKDKFGFWVTERSPEDWSVVKDIITEGLSEDLKENLNNNRASSCNLQEVDEHKLDSSINKYLTEVYDNVASYKTSDISIDRKTDQLLVEGTIDFKDKKSLNTKFIFEGRDYNKSTNRLVLRGLNESISSYKDAFELVGKIDKGNFLTESLSYVYKVADTDKTKLVNGKVD